MGKDLFIAEKPSVAREFAKALKYNMSNRDRYMAVSYTHLDVYKRQPQQRGADHTESKNQQKAEYGFV